MKNPTRPISFQISNKDLKSINQIIAKNNLKSFGEFVRFAINELDTGVLPNAKEERTQVSVRVGEENRKTLERLNKKSGVSVGEIIRLSLEQVLDTANNHDFSQLATKKEAKS